MTLMTPAPVEPTTSSASVMTPLAPERPVRRLNAEERARCSELAVSRDWGAEERKWELLFDVGEVYGIDDEEGRLIATSVLTRYGSNLAAVSMVLVAESHERQGYGTQIMRHVLGQADGSTVVLHSTPQGRPLYETLGFQSFGSVEMHFGVFDATGTTNGLTSAAEEADYAEIARIDREVYGADRDPLLKKLPTFAERIRVLRSDQGGLAGFGASWRNGETTVVGPVIAPDFAGARDLITDLVEGIEGDVRLDVDSECDDLSAWACGHGLKPQYACSHMVLGGRAPMDPTRLHAPLMCALG